MSISFYPRIERDHENLAINTFASFPCDLDRLYTATVTSFERGTHQVKKTVFTSDTSSHDVGHFGRPIGWLQWHVGLRLSLEPHRQGALEIKM
jgi:hypothetical protein